MGIIIDQLFHTEKGITEEKYKCFFFDMGENIHFHYRDLRIELSVEEFKELIESIDRYKGDVLKEIDNGYMDGVLPNTNEKHTVKTFWNRERLQHSIKYNPQRISIEENTDGYHIHFRHYKFLLDKPSFISFAEGMAQSLNRANSKGEIDPLELLRLNELHPKLIIKTITNSGEETRIKVQKKYFSKTRQVLNGLGYNIIGTDNLKQVYEKENKKIIALLEDSELIDISSDDVSSVTQLIPLISFIPKVAISMDAASLNKLKLNLLYLFKQAENKVIQAFSLDDINVNIFDNNVIIQSTLEDNINIKREYDKLSALYSEHKLSMVKPKKKKYNRKYIQYIADKFKTYIDESLSPLPCVSKIYLFGSMGWETGGEYEQPFVHMEWAKLGSDFDIFIEIDEDYIDSIPKEWDKKFFHKPASAYYYHLGDLVEKTHLLPIVAKYDGIRFYQHLLEAYLFLPSKGDETIKEQYIQQYKGKLLYNRDEAEIISHLKKKYKINIIKSKRFSANSHNKVYKIICDNEVFAYKVYNRKTSLQAGTVEYEVNLLNQLKNSDLEIAYPIASTTGDFITEINGNESVLFDYIAGEFVSRPNIYQAKLAGDLVARFHKQASEIKLDFANKHTQHHIYKLWIDNASEFVKQGKMDCYLLKELTILKKKLGKLSKIETFLHGDLSPKNFKYMDNQCYLIDFEQVTHGLRLFDLIDAMIEFSLVKGDCRKEVADVLFDAYNTVFPLTKTQLNKFNDALEIAILAKITRLYRTHLVFNYNLQIETINGLKKCYGVLLR